MSDLCIKESSEKYICPNCRSEFGPHGGFLNPLGKLLYCSELCVDEANLAATKLRKVVADSKKEKHDPFHDPVKKPRHYTSSKSGVECIKVTEHMNFCLGNAMKYIWRADLKNGSEDLKKAIWYLEREITRRVLSGESK